MLTPVKIISFIQNWKHLTPYPFLLGLVGSIFCNFTWRLNIDVGLESVLLCLPRLSFSFAFLFVSVRFWHKNKFCLIDIYPRFWLAFVSLSHKRQSILLPCHREGHKCYYTGIKLLSTCTQLKFWNVVLSIWSCFNYELFLFTLWRKAPKVENLNPGDLHHS